MTKTSYYLDISIINTNKKKWRKCQRYDHIEKRYRYTYQCRVWHVGSKLLSSPQAVQKNFVSLQAFYPRERNSKTLKTIQTTQCTMHRKNPKQRIFSSLSLKTCTATFSASMKTLGLYIHPVHRHVHSLTYLHTLEKKGHCVAPNYKLFNLPLQSLSQSTQKI